MDQEWFTVGTTESGNCLQSAYRAHRGSFHERLQKLSYQMLLLGFWQAPHPVLDIHSLNIPLKQPSSTYKSQHPISQDISAKMTCYSHNSQHPKGTSKLSPLFQNGQGSSAKLFEAIFLFVKGSILFLFFSLLFDNYMYSKTS